MLRNCLSAMVVAFGMCGAAHAQLATGDPAADGWSSHGNSLSNGVYSRGGANFGFQIYSAAFTVTPGSMFDITDGAHSWLPGDVVLGVGGVFEDISAGDAGWGSFTGPVVNNLHTSPMHGPKLVAKFGTSDATYSASTTAPGSGNGQGSTAAGGIGTVFVRSSGWFHATDPVQSQDSDTTWLSGDNQLMLLDKPSHISREGDAAPDTRVARLMWDYDPMIGKPRSWQILLNVSLLDRLSPGFAGLTPAPGDLTIVSVQDRDSVYTDAVIRTVPAPGALALLGLAGVCAARRRRG